jgi:hypothetical protein
MVIDHTDPFAPSAKPDPGLIRAIVNAHRFNENLLHGRARKFADLAKREKLHRSYYSQILRLAYLAPDITTAILEGRQPAGGGLASSAPVGNPASSSGSRGWRARPPAPGGARPSRCRYGSALPRPGT